MCSGDLRLSQSGGRLYILHHRPESASGDANDGVLSSAFDPPFWVRVPVPGHAGLGAMGRRDFTQYALPSCRSRRTPEGQWSGTIMAGHMAAYSLSVRSRNCVIVALPPDP